MQQFKRFWCQKKKRMLKTTLLSLTILVFIDAFGQSKKSIEISIVGRYDRHADYVSNFAGRVYNDTNKLYGISYGFNIGYRRQVSKTISAYLGFGYFKLGIDKIKGSMPFNILGVRTGRSINNEDDDSTKLGYSTSKYHYNNLAFTVGLSKSIFLKDNLKFEVGVEGIGYYNFSQGYKLMNKYHYSTNNSKPIEFGVNASIGFFKEHNKFYFRPALLIPIYQNLKGDKVFFEDRNMNISKWFNGFGLTVRVGKYL